MNLPKNIKIGTRDSTLALYQAEEVRKKISHLYPEIENIELVKIKTTGDKFLQEDISAIGGKVIFTKEIEDALLENIIDIAVHSAKDLATIIPQGLEISGYLPREEVGDVLISHKYNSLKDLPKKARLGTSAIRRKAAIKHHFPEFKIISYRGNINSRINRIAENNLDGIILAQSGVKRIGKESIISEIINKNIILPSAGQGAIAIQIRDNDNIIKDIIKRINCKNTEFTVSIERQLMLGIDGDCKTPFGCLVEILDEQNISIRMQIIHPSGSLEYRDKRICKKENIDTHIIEMIKAAKINAKEILDAIKNE